MADSVVSLLANVATIGGHVAEMISIFVYPVVGYFWTRRRRRSPSLDFNMPEESPRSMSSVTGTMDPIASLKDCIASLMLVLQALESLAADEALSRVCKGIVRFEKLMVEHRSLQETVSSLAEELTGAAAEAEDQITTIRGNITRMSQKIRLLQLKGEMLSVETRQAKIVYTADSSVAASFGQGVDLERGFCAQCSGGRESAVSTHEKAERHIEQVGHRADSYGSDISIGSILSSSSESTIFRNAEPYCKTITHHDY